MNFKNLHTKKVILGSSSPRRKELLRDLGFEFKVINPSYEENSEDDGYMPAKRVMLNAKGKLYSILQKIKEENQDKDALIISADTIVHLGNEILEKPKSYDEAFSMLARLSGNTHKVHTGLFLFFTSKDGATWQKYEEVITEVQFKKLSEDEIHTYLKLGEYKDKAGSYAIQGKGSYMVRSIKGSHSNVIGLPLCELSDILNALEKEI